MAACSDQSASRRARGLDGAGGPAPGVILFLGDSLTEGHDLNRSQAYPALIEVKLREHGWPYSVVNAGVSGDTTDDGLRRLPALLNRPVSVLVVALGVNDTFQGVSIDEIKRNLQAIIDQTRAAYPQVRLVMAGVRLTGDWAMAYGGPLRKMYADLAEANHAALLPSLLEGVAGNPDLNLPDGLHPNAQGHIIMAEQMWKVLEPVLKQ